VYPVVGTFLMVVGLLLLSRISLTIGDLTIAGYLFVFGVGLGLVLQILVVAAQNAVPQEQLGTATSGVTFFRAIGGSFGTAIFGAIFANLLANNVIDALHLHNIPANLKASLNAANPTSLTHLPRAIHAGVTSGMVNGLETVDRLLNVLRSGFQQLLEGWDPETHPEIGAMTRRLAHELLADDATLMAAAISSQGSGH